MGRGFDRATDDLSVHCSCSRSRGLKRSTGVLARVIDRGFEAQRRDLADARDAHETGADLIVMRSLPHASVQLHEGVEQHLPGVKLGHG